MADTTRPMLIPAPAPVPLEQKAPTDEILLVPAPPKQTARALRPLWRDLIIRVWGGDPLRCPCCKATMKVVGTLQRPEENRKTPKACRCFGQEPAQRVTCPAGVKGRGAALNQFFLLLQGLWEPKRSGDRLPAGQPEGWSDSEINVSSTCPDRRPRPSTSKNAEGL